MRNLIITICLVACVLMISGCDTTGDAKGGVAAECSDNIDNDGDGLIDLNDPGCPKKNDKDESAPLHNYLQEYTTSLLY